MSTLESKQLAGMAKNYIFFAIQLGRMEGALAQLRIMRTTYAEKDIQLAIGAALLVYCNQEAK